MTQGEWLSVFGGNPSRHGQGLQHPVEGMTWWDALAYANARSMAEGLSPVYRLTDCAGQPGLGMTCANVEVLAPGGSPYLAAAYRLPTEAEWEYAARAGTTTNLYIGHVAEGDPRIADAAWYEVNAGGTTKPVRTRPANPWGLFDMAGNVFNWVWDAQTVYPASATDPWAPYSGQNGIWRGGCYHHGLYYLRSAARYFPPLSTTGFAAGVRLARTHPAP